MFARASALATAARRTFAPTPIEKFTTAASAGNIEEMFSLALIHSDITPDRVETELAALFPRGTGKARLNQALQKACITLFLAVNATNLPRANTLLMCFFDRNADFNYRPTGLSNPTFLHIDSFIRACAVGITDAQDRFLRVFATLKNRQREALMHSAISASAAAPARAYRAPAPAAAAAAPAVAADSAAARGGAGALPIPSPSSSTPRVSTDPIASSEEDSLSVFMAHHPLHGGRATGTSGRTAVLATPFRAPLGRLDENTPPSTGRTAASDPKPVG